MFEIFNVEKLRFISQPIAALYASGIQSGIILHIGASGTAAVPVYCGFNGQQHTSSAGGQTLLQRLRSRLAGIGTPYLRGADIFKLDSLLRGEDK